MAVSQGRSVERSRLAWLSIRLPPLGWLTNDVPAGRGFAVAWLKRGASAMEVSGIRRARHGLLPASMEREYSDGGSDDRGRSAQGFAYGGGDQRGGGATG